MRVTVNLDADLYAVTVALAKAEDCSISAAVNRLPRRSLPEERGHGAPLPRRNHVAISRGRKPIAADDIARADAEDDTA